MAVPARRRARSQPASPRALARAQPRRSAARLRRFAPDAVGVGGWNQPAFVRTLAYAKTHRIPILVVGREHRARRAQRPRARSSSRSARSCARTTASSCRDRRRPSTCGRSASSRIGSRSRRTRSTRACSSGPREPSDGTVRFLYVGRLDPEKGLDVLLRGVRGRAGRARARRRRAPRKPSCGHAQATASGSRARWRATKWLRGTDARRRVRAAVALRAVGDGAERGRSRGASRSSPPTGSARRASSSRTASTASACPSATSARSPRRCAGSPSDAAFRTAAGARSRELVARLTPDAWADGVAGLARRLAAQRSS